MTVSFTKLADGSWGLKGYHHELAVGRSVNVKKKDGTFKVIKVGDRVGGDKVQSVHRIAGEERRQSSRSGGGGSFYHPGTFERANRPRRRCRCARPLDEGDGECMYCGHEIG